MILDKKLGNIRLIVGGELSDAKYSLVFEKFSVGIYRIRVLDQKFTNQLNKTCIAHYFYYERHINLLKCRVN